MTSFPIKPKTAAKRQANHKRRPKDEPNQCEANLMKQRELMKKTTENRQKIVRKRKETRKCREIRLLKRAFSQKANKVNSSRE